MQPHKLGIVRMSCERAGGMKTRGNLTLLSTWSALFVCPLFVVASDQFSILGGTTESNRHFSIVFPAITSSYYLIHASDTPDSPATWSLTGMALGVEGTQAWRNGDALVECDRRFYRVSFRDQNDSVDSDADGMDDVWELRNSLNPLDCADANLDSDGDGIENEKECRAGTSPLLWNAGRYLCGASLDIQSKTLAATRSKCGFAPYVEETNVPAHLYKAMSEIFQYELCGYEVITSEYSGELCYVSDSKSGCRYVVSEWDVSTCGVHSTVSGTYAGEAEDTCRYSEKECSFSGYWDAGGAFHCTDSASGPQGHLCGMAGYECPAGVSILEQACGDTVQLSRTEIRRESTHSWTSGYSSCSYHGILSSEYGTDELISRTSDDLDAEPCGGFETLDWFDGWHFHVSSDCDHAVYGAAYRHLTPDETQLTLEKMRYRVGIQTETGFVYRLEWVERFIPEAGGDCEDKLVVDYVSGDGGMVYTRPHDVAPPAENGEVYIDSTNTEFSVASLVPDEGSEIDDKDGNPNTRLFAVRVEPGKQVKVEASLDPNWANTYVPTCFAMSGGCEGSHPRERSVDRSAAGLFVITASIGSSQKETTIAVLKVEIKAADGTSDPQEYVDADSEVASFYNAVSYQAVVTPSIPGTFTWSTTSTKITLTDASSQTVTVNAGPDASDTVAAEDLQVEFTPSGSSVSCDATHALTVVHCTYAAYSDRVGLGHGWWRFGLEPADATILIDPIDIRIWANQEAGYFPVNVGDPVGPGYVKMGPQGHTPTAQHTWDIPLFLLVNGLTYCRDLANSPGTYNVLLNNCCHKVIESSCTCGVNIPNDNTDPETLHDYLSSL